MALMKQEWIINQVLSVFEEEKQKEGRNEMKLSGMHRKWEGRGKLEKIFRRKGKNRRIVAFPGESLKTHENLAKLFRVIQTSKSDSLRNITSGQCQWSPPAVLLHHKRANTPSLSHSFS